MRIGIAALGDVSGDTGGRNYLEHFLRTLATADHSHTIVLFLSEGQFEKLDLGTARPEIIRVPNSSRTPLHKVIGEQLRLPTLIRDANVNVMYFPGNFASFSCPVPYVLNIRAVPHYYGSAYGVDLPRRVMRKLLMPFSATRAAKIIAPSNDIKKDIIRFVGVKTDKIEVIPHGVDTSLFDGEKNRNDPLGDSLIKQYGIEKGEYLLYVSALWQYKNQDKLIQAHARIVKQTHREITLVLAGKGTGTDDKYLSRLHQLPKELGTEHLVRFVGQLKQSELRFLYANAKAFIFPSRYESFGNPIFEAWSSGIPLAASNVHSFPEIIDDAGLLFDPNDNSAFDNALQQVVSDEKLRQQLILRGLDRVKEFTWERCVMRTLSVLEGVKRFD